MGREKLDGEFYPEEKKQIQDWASSSGRASSDFDVNRPDGDQPKDAGVMPESPGSLPGPTPPDEVL